MTKMRFKRRCILAFAIVGVANSIVPAMANGDVLNCFNPSLLPNDLAVTKYNCSYKFNVASASCSRHEDLATHAEGLAIDMNIVDGEKVASDNDKARQLQQKFHEDPSAVENFGPFMQERRGADGTWRDVEVCPDEYQDFIHIGVAP